MRNLFVVILVSVVQFGFAQSILSSEWENGAVIHSIEKDDQNYPAVVLFDKRTIRLDDLNTQHSKTHKLIHFNNDKGVQQYNRLYLPLYNGTKLKFFKGRAIKKDGSVTEITQDDLKKLENVEGIGEFSAFAFEGLEVGGELEIMYTLQENLDACARIILQDDNPVKHAELNVIDKHSGSFETDKQLRNCEVFLDSIQWADIQHDRRFISLSNLPAHPEDDNKVDLIGIDYCITKYSNFGQTATFFTGKRLVERTETKFRTNLGIYRKVVRKGIKGKKIKKVKSNEEKIKLFAEYIQENFRISEKASKRYGNSSQMIRAKTINDQVAAIIYTQFLDKIKVPFELRITTNRFNSFIEDDFLSYLDLTQYLIYLPTFDKYIFPDIEGHVLSVPAYWYSPINSLRILGRRENTFRYYTGNGEIVANEPADTLENMWNMSIDLRLNTDNNSNTLSFDKTWSGNWAINKQRAYYFKNAEDKQAYINEQIEDYAHGGTIVNSDFKNFDLNSQTYGQPINISATIENVDIISYAGDKILVDIGKAFGTQNEMYNDKTPINPTRLSYKMNYKYVVTMNIPEGYEIENFDHLNMYVPDSDSLPTVAWKSSAKIIDNLLIIHIHEFYNKLEYSPEEWVGYRKAYNAASDYEKRTIVLKKK